MNTINNFLNKELKLCFRDLNLNEDFAFFQYSNRPDLSDFQTNCAMPLAKILHQNPRDIASKILEYFKDKSFVESISIDGPGFINLTVKNDILLSYINACITDDKLGYSRQKGKRKVIIDFAAPNVAKEMHVGHLRSTVIGESLRRIYSFCGDEVISDMHQGDWGSNMGVVIESIRLKYPNLKCFKPGFDENLIDDLQLSASELTDIYRLGAAKAKEDPDFFKKTREATKLLQDGYKPYRVLWEYFSEVSLDDIRDICCGIFSSHFDLFNGESSVHYLIQPMIDDLVSQGYIVESDGAKVIDLSEDNLLPLIVQKSDGAFLYATTDMASLLFRTTEYKPDLILYVVDGRQSEYFRQILAAGKKVGYLNDHTKAIHCAFGTMNGKDGKPYKTRSGDIVRLRYLVDETISKVSEKSKVKDKECIKNIAVACIKFADLINYRELDYIFDLERFTSFDGKTGAYILYNLVRINSILESYDSFDYMVTQINNKAERNLVFNLMRFVEVVENSYVKQSPNFIADYAYSLAKDFSSFYTICNINNEKDPVYKKSKLSLLFLTKRSIETCLYLLGIKPVDRM